MPSESTCASPSSDCASPFGVRKGLDRRVLELGFFSGLVAFAAFLSNATHALLDDGPQLVQDFGSPEAPPIWNHVLYFPVARLFSAFGLTADQALLLTSCVSGAVMVAAAAMIGWIVTGRRSIGAWAAAATMTAPVVAVHSTFVEVHALHGACVAVALLATLACPPRTVALFCVTALGAALAGLSHRSAALLAPALSAVAASRLLETRQPPTHACFRSALAVALGLAIAGLVDERLHGEWGGPGLLVSVQQVEEALPASISTMLLDESLLSLGPALALCAVLAAAHAWSIRTHARSALLLVAPGLAFSVYGGAIVAASVPTQGGYWMGSVPFLALAFAACATRWLPLDAPASWVARVASACVVATGLALTVQSTWSDDMRASLQSQRNQRAGWAASLMPFGGHLLTSSLSKQYVDGVALGVREHDFGPEIARRLLTGNSPESIAAELRMCIDRLTATDAEATVAWTCEWRATEAAGPFAPALLRIEEIAFRGLRTTPVRFGPFDAFVLERLDRH